MTHPEGVNLETLLRRIDRALDNELEGTFQDLAAEWVRVKHDLGIPVDEAGQ